jgi:hypothetical protein
LHRQRQTGLSWARHTTLRRLGFGSRNCQDDKGQSALRNRKRRVILRGARTARCASRAYEIQVILAGRRGPRPSVGSLGRAPRGRLAGKSPHNSSRGGSVHNAFCPSLSCTVRRVGWNFCEHGTCRPFHYQHSVGEPHAQTHRGKTHGANSHGVMKLACQPASESAAAAARVSDGVASNRVAQSPDSRAPLYRSC